MLLSIRATISALAILISSPRASSKPPRSKPLPTIGSAISIRPASPPSPPAAYPFAPRPTPNWSSPKSSTTKKVWPRRAGQQALLVADQNIGTNFSTATKFAATNLPSSLQPIEIFADGQDPTAVSQQIFAALNTGPLLVNYSGHGAEEQWSFSDLLDDTTAANLSNGNQLSVYFLMDCLNGFFQDVYATRSPTPCSSLPMAAPPQSGPPPALPINRRRPP